MDTLSPIKTLLEIFQKQLGKDAVIDHAQALLVYECDGFTIAKGNTGAVIFPSSTSQIAQCIKKLTQAQIEIVPRGSGTGLTGGCVAFDGGVLISTTRMNQIKSIDLPNRMARVQAGVINASLSDAVAQSALRFSPDPSSQKASTIGGNAATNAGGINTLKYGVTTNHILGVEYVLSDGQVVRSGAQGLFDHEAIDLTRLIVGSEGTLGLITEIWCRLTPRPRHFRTVFAVFKSSVDACQTVSDITAQGILPTSMEMLDGNVIQVVEETFHLGFPHDAQAMLLIEIDGVQGVLDEQLACVVALCKQNNATRVIPKKTESERQALWAARKKAFGALGKITRSYCTQDACIPRSKLPQALVAFSTIAEPYGKKISNIFHAGDGNVHPIIMFDEDDPEDVQAVMHLSHEILDYCLSIGGTITGEHGVGVEKIEMMPRMFNEDTMALFQEIKNVFDVSRTINEGKLIPSDKINISLIN